MILSAGGFAIEEVDGAGVFVRFGVWFVEVCCADPLLHALVMNELTTSVDMVRFIY